MPWNPMRVEQRIGRIDRIGQRFEEIWIRNYFYSDTVEAVVYQRLGDRIGWFEEVVGELQPILHRVAGTIERAAMMNPAERGRRLDEMIGSLRAEIEHKSVEGLDLDAFVDEQLRLAEAGPPPVTLQDIERAVVESQSLGKRFMPHPEIPGAHLLSWRGEAFSVTFSPQIFDRYPNTVQLLSYGNPLLDELLASAGDPPASDEPEGLGLFRSRSSPRVSLFLRADDGGVRAVQSLADLLAVLSAPPDAWDAGRFDQARALFERTREEATRRPVLRQNRVRLARVCEAVARARIVARPSAPSAPPRREAESQWGTARSRTEE
jgi:hypothetical protein